MVTHMQDDEFFWAASELYFSNRKRGIPGRSNQKLTRHTQLRDEATRSHVGIFTWLQPGRELNEADHRFADSLKTELLKYADKVLEGAEQTPFHAPYGNDAKDFFWGCLAEKCMNLRVYR